MGKENESLVKARQDAKEQNLLTQLRETFLDADENQSMALDKNEFCKMFENKFVRSTFDEIGVPTSSPGDIFQLFDRNDHDEIDLHDFFNGVLRLKGEAGGKDMQQIVGLSKSISR